MLQGWLGFVVFRAAALALGAFLVRLVAGGSPGSLPGALPAVGRLAVVAARGRRRS